MVRELVVVITVDVMMKLTLHGRLRIVRIIVEYITRKSASILPVRVCAEVSKSVLLFIRKPIVYLLYVVNTDSGRIKMNV